MKRHLILSLLLPVAIVASAAAAPTKPAEVLPFIHDDYARAVSVAKTKQLPLFVEAWAPW